VLLPWRRRNLNHVGTMHACALATAAEYASGLCLLNAMEHQQVRLVMANLNITYPRRAQSACTAVAKLDSRHLEDILAQLDKEGRGAFVLKAQVKNADNEVVASAEITWHLKRLLA
jgi:acyl-coenzyme A thioesterase PaaI-like protein